MEKLPGEKTDNSVWKSPGNSRNGTLQRQRSTQSLLEKQFRVRLFSGNRRSSKKVEGKTVKYEFNEKMSEISGFGGDYEAACRRMVVAGVEWLDSHPGANPRFDQYKNIYGITANENADMKEMQKVMADAAPDPSGQMMQATTNHVLIIKKRGWDWYCLQMEKEPEDREKI